VVLIKINLQLEYKYLFGLFMEERVEGWLPHLLGFILPIVAIVGVYLDWCRQQLPLQYLLDLLAGFRELSMPMNKAIEEKDH
jgi:hypothetical protein